MMKNYPFRLLTVLKQGEEYTINSVNAKAQSKEEIVQHQTQKSTYRQCSDCGITVYTS